MLRLTHEALRLIFPRASEEIIAAFLEQQDVLARSGISASRTRLAYLFANLGHETAGFTIRELTESMNYTHQRAAEVWPSRFASAGAVAAKYGSGIGWQRRLFDDVYGNRMGNRPGTDDGSRYIGRGGPQITGRDGYREIGRRTGLALEQQPELATKAKHQPTIAAAFWDWKRLNETADAGDFRACVRRWNGGLIGLADREARLKQCSAVLAKLVDVSAAPTTPAPPPPHPASSPPPPAAPTKTWFDIFIDAVKAILAAFRRR